MENLKILLIEDDTIDQMAFKRLVKQQNLSYQYTIVNSVAETRKLLRSNQFNFDVVLSDYHLGDGFALDFLADIIKTNIPVIITTGSGDEKVAVKAMKLGAYDYIIKDPDRNYLTILPLTVENAINHKKNETQSKLLSHAFKNVKDLVYITDQEHKIIFVNQSFCQAYGYTEAEIIGEIGNFLYDNSSINKQNLFLNYEELNMETFARKKDGFVFPISLSKTIFQNNNVLNTVYIIRDITEQKQAEQKLKESLAKEKEINELKTSFISMVSHDFRSPLSGILSSIDFLEYYHDTLEKKDYLEYFSLIRSTCHQMLQLLEDLLVIGRSETGKLKLDPRSINLEEVCRQIIAEIQLSDQENHLIKFSFSDIRQQNIYLDYQALRHILINLLSNAIKYSPAKSSVEFNIFLEEKNQQIIFKIKDQGIGIPSKEQTHLFESFFRAKNVGKIQGTGLGLAIVHKYVTLMKGIIKFESELNQGTTFFIEIPLIYDQS